MNILKNTYKWLLTLGLLVSLGSCSLFDLDVNTDPNNPTSADYALLLPSAQLGAVGYFEALNNNTHGFMGWLASGDTYDLTFTSYNGTWNSFYSGPMKDLEEMIVSAERDQVTNYLGVAQVMKAYFFGNFVDMFGDVPYSEAFAGGYEASIINPKFDDDQAIYTDLIKLCDNAVVNLAKPTSVSLNGDLFYAGNVTRWRKLAKTVKLRLLINSRLVDPAAKTAQIKAILDEGDYITSAADDFVFKYNKIAAPDGRHPWYRNAYVASNSAFTYFLHQPVVEMLRDDDPRTPFYFKRQTSKIFNPEDPTDASTIPCSQIAGCTYAYLIANPQVIKTLYTDKGKTFTAADRAYLAGFFGRDRGDISGVPADVDFRLSPGAYPAAGSYDVPTASKTGGTGARFAGDGIQPIITSWMTKYYQIEAILMLGVAGDAKAAFEKAMREQIAKVVALGMASDPAAVAPTAAAIDKYVKLYLDKFDEAPNASQKLNVALKQAWFSNLGNGYEIYNAFRRTGYPNDLQIPIQRIRNFPLRLPQPQQETSLNQNAPQGNAVPAFDSPAGAIFWDMLKFKF
ncbi:SusD/RagB family nutrient-binding outer membrane lipoprotein [Persicitalea jodogahamensis]|uniref:SusD/RagB family nutrient-binding outer membrane lipoprotein n=1 Tax=Persicitalea jodogahamensis TaxID=402147 RepID=A0A8J3D9M5_9BACT|nr:SusD/RagB family nutrient-binding outer membrane lipoprotein [Persicitalea jodogahamensis]GHB72386.1 hypothetical protein GCM10007390_28050 [Persicitalea jodogahamensis]